MGLITSGGSREGVRGALVSSLVLDQTEARRAEKNFGDWLGGGGGGGGGGGPTGLKKFCFLVPPPPPPRLILGSG